MTSPVEEIRVECPRCATTFDDWTRGSVNLDLDDFDDDYLRRASTATCPSCGHVVTLGILVVKDGAWRLPPAYAEAVKPLRLTEAGRRLGQRQVYAEIAAMEAALRERFGDEHELLRPGLLRGTLWLQAAAWAVDAGESG